MTAPRALADALRERAGWFERLGLFYHLLFLSIAEDVESYGVWRGPEAHAIANAGHHGGAVVLASS